MFVLNAGERIYGNFEGFWGNFIGILRVFGLNETGQGLSSFLLVLKWLRLFDFLDLMNLRFLILKIIFIQAQFIF